VSGLAVWQITDAAPTLVRESPVKLEANLESWIEQCPSLVQFGLTILGRQVRVEAGPIDLLAIDSQGRLCIIELKRDLVDRMAMAQVQDYAACLAQMSGGELRGCLQSHLTSRDLDLDAILDERDAQDALDPESRRLSMYVVGTRISPGLERFVRFLSEQHGLPVFVKRFTVYESENGERFLVRETSEEEVEKPAEKSAARGQWTIESVRADATAAGLGDAFDVIEQAARKHGLGIRPWKNAVMYTPPTDGRRCFITVWSKPRDGKLKIFLETPLVSEFWPVSVEDARDALGEAGYRLVDQDGAQALACGLDDVLPADEA